MPVAKYDPDQAMREIEAILLRIRERQYGPITCLEVEQMPILSSVQGEGDENVPVYTAAYTNQS